MWILPKQLHTSRYVADMTELGLDSEEFGQQSERSLMWRSNPSQQRTWSQRWKRVSWMRHLSGRILKHSQRGDFEDAWTSSVRDSRANHSVVREQEQQTTTPDTSGLTFDNQLDLFDHGWLCLKTSKESSAPNSKGQDGTTQKEHRFCSMSLENWKEQVTAVRGEYSQRVKLELPTSGSGSSSLGWQTPRVSQGGVCPSELKRNSPNLEAQVWQSPTVSTGAHRQKDGTPVEVGQRAYDKETGSHRTWGLSQATQVAKDWRTPTVAEVKNQCNSTQIYLQNQVGATEKKGKDWPTPASRDHKGTYQTLQRKDGKMRGDLLPDAVNINCQQGQEKSSTSGKNPGPLNPAWVEQLMGLPVGWTDFDSSEMELCPKPQNEQ
jgi:hypothetical protein